jgi:pimeloyl-ACP methyl ester carboxylesterase
MEWIASGARVAAAAGRRGVLAARLPGVIAGGSRWSASASAAAASTGAAVKLSAKVPVRFKNKLPSADKPPCVILHGMLGSASNWRGLLARGDLFDSDQYIAAVDLRNHGSSEHASTMTYPEMCKDVIEYSRMLGVDKAHIIGHSMGGKVAMTLALTVSAQSPVYHPMQPCNHATMQPCIRAISLFPSLVSSSSLFSATSSERI